MADREMPPDVAAAFAKASKQRSSDAALTTILIEEIAKVLNPIHKELRDRIAALEAQPAAKWAGVWREGKTYIYGNLCTDHGALWHCEAPTMRRPGQCEDWKLILKRGSAR